MVSRVYVGGTKVCSRCGEEKSRSEFSPRRKDEPDGHVVSACRPCAAAVTREWYARNQDKVFAYQRATRRARHLKHKYGISVEQYDEMLNRQGGACAICKQPPQDEHLHVDHDHETGRVRGLLCQGCNHGIGNFLDDVTLLQSAQEYLRGEVVP